MAQGKLKDPRLFVIGGSAGSLKVVLKIIPLLRLGMNVSIIIVFHRKKTEDDVLLNILTSKTEYKVKEAEDKDELCADTIYIVPADYHLLIEKNKTITLDASEKVHFSRPSIDVTFESAADAYGNLLVCLLLSGANADGVSGLIKAKAAGAKIVVQDPASAEVSYMPQQALDKVQADVIIDEENLSEYLALFKITEQ